MSLLLFWKGLGMQVYGTSAVTQSTHTTTSSGEAIHQAYGDDYQTGHTTTSSGEAIHQSDSVITATGHTTTAAGTVTSGGPPPPVIGTRPIGVHTGWNLKPNAIFRAMGRR